MKRLLIWNRYISIILDILKGFEQVLAVAGRAEEIFCFVRFADSNFNLLVLKRCLETLKELRIQFISIGALDGEHA